MWNVPDALGSSQKPVGTQNTCLMTLLLLAVFVDYCCAASNTECSEGL